MEIDARQYDEKGEAGGFGAAAGKVQVIQLINHDGRELLRGTQTSTALFARTAPVFQYTLAASSSPAWPLVPFHLYLTVCS